MLLLCLNLFSYCLWSRTEQVNLASVKNTDPKTIKLSFWPTVCGQWNLFLISVSVSSRELCPPSAPLLYKENRDLWSVAPAGVYLLTSGSTLLSSLTLPRHFTDKRCGSLNWLVFLWDPSWGKSENGWKRVLGNLLLNVSMLKKLSFFWIWVKKWSQM